MKHQEVVRQQSRRKTTRLVLIVVGAIAGVFLLAWVASNFVGDDDPAPVDTVVTLTVPTDTSASTGEPVTTTPDTTPTSAPADATTATTEG